MIIALRILHIVAILTIAVMLWNKQTLLKRWFLPALIFKLLAGIALGVLYVYYYPSGDTFSYFRDASALASLAKQDLTAYLQAMSGDTSLLKLEMVSNDGRAFFMTRIVSLFSLATGDSYWITGLYFSLISFVAAWHLVLTISCHIPKVSRAAVIAFLFVPSIVFWTSGLLKESLAMASLYFLTAVFLRIWFGEKRGWGSYLLVTVCLVIFWKLKYYYVAGFIPVAVTSLFFRSFVAKRLNYLAKFQELVWLLMMIIPLVLFTFLHPNFDIDRIFDVIVDNNAAYREMSAPGDAIIFDDLRPTLLSILIHSPWAVFSGLFRPLFWEAGSGVAFLAGVENTLLFLLFLAALTRVKSYTGSPHRILVVATLVFVVLLCVFITISAPNFGTLSRYRVGYLSFFVFILLCENPVVDYLERSISRLVSQ